MNRKIQDSEPAHERGRVHPDRLVRIGKDSKFKSLIFEFEKLYSDRKLFTGFISAALIAWNETVSSVMKSAPAPAEANIHQGMFTRYS
jgi:hypothetical protein